MSDANVPVPSPGTDPEAGVRHYAQHITRGPDRQDAANLLQGWLTDQICVDADPGDYGALYCVWAELGDVAHAYEDQETFDEAARLAAEEWLAGGAEPGQRHAWVARWNEWLRTYGETHTVVWQRQ